MRGLVAKSFPERVLALFPPRHAVVVGEITAAELVVELYDARPVVDRRRAAAAGLCCCCRRRRRPRRGPSMRQRGGRLGRVRAPRPGPCPFPSVPRRG